MKQFLDDHKLKDMAVPTVQSGPHHTALRRVLVSRAAQRADGKQLTLRGAINSMKKRTIITSSVVGMAALAVVAYSSFGPSQSVNALQLAQNTSNALAQMTPQEQASTSPQEAQYQKFYPTFVKWMNEAQKAPDLRILSYGQLIKAYPEAMQEHPTTGEPLRIIDNPRDGQKPNVHELRYLEFGTMDGDTKLRIVVGVNSQNVPEAALTHIVKAGAPRVEAPSPQVIVR